MNSKGQFSIIAALLVAVVLIGTVITTYATLRYSTSQDQPQVLSAIDETNLAFEKVLGFTVGYYGSVLQVTGDSSYAKSLTMGYLRKSLGNMVDIKPEWGSSFNLVSLDLSANWFTNNSYSAGQAAVNYSLTGLGISGMSYDASCRLDVQVSTLLPTSQACLSIFKDGNEPLINLDKQNFKFYRYTNLTWDYATPTGELTAFANGTYLIDIPSGIDPLSYVVQVTDTRGIMVAAASFSRITSVLMWNTTTPQGNDYVDVNTSDVDSSPSKGTQSNFTAQQYGPDNIYDTLVEGASGTVPISYYPNSLNLRGSTSSVSGTIADLQSDNGQYMVFGSYYSGTNINSYVNQLSNVDSSPDKGTHSNFTAQRYGPDSTYDTLTEATTDYTIEKVGIATSGTGNSLTLSFSHSLISGSNRLVVVCFGAEHNGIAVSGVTYGGNPMTLAVSFETPASGTKFLSQIWYILESNLPSDGAKTVTVTATGSTSGLEVNAFCSEYTGVGQLAPEATDGVSQTSGNTITNTINPSTNAWVISAVGSGNRGSWMHGSPQVEVLDFNDASSCFAVAELRGASGQTSLSSTFSGTVNRLARVSASFRKAVTNQLDLEVQWTNVNYTQANEELCIYAGGNSNTHSLDATGGYMVVGSGTPNWGSTSGTISFWVKWDAVGGRPWGQHENMEIRFSGNSLVLDWGQTGSITSSSSFVTDKWYFIAIVWNENTNRLYLYVGDKDNAPTLDAQNTAWTAAVSTVGVAQNNFMASKGGVEPTDGHGEELRYWNIDRTLAAIQSDFNTELTGSETNLRSYFKLNNSFDDAGPADSDGSGVGSFSFQTDTPFGSPPTETIRVDVWTGSAWQNMLTNLANGWNNFSVSSYLTSQNFTIRFKGGTETSDVVQDQWKIDVALLHTWSDESTVEVEFVGSTNMENWNQLNWTVNSAWNTSLVNVTLQLYNYALGSYPTSGNGYISYASNSTPNTNETKTQTINTNPTDFRNATGYWKLKIKGVKLNSSSFDMKIDSVVFSPRVPNYALDIEEQWNSLNYVYPRQTLCIKTGALSINESLIVDVRFGSSWITVFNSLQNNTWNNVSVTQYINSSTFTIRFRGSNDVSDPTQDSWNLDAVLLSPQPDVDVLLSSLDHTIVVELLQNGTMRWLGQNLTLTTKEQPIPPVPVKAIHVNQTINGVNQEVPFQVEDWASEYRIPVGLTNNAAVFSNRQMIVFLVNVSVSKVTVWWNGSDTATQTPLAYTNQYFQDDPDNGILKNENLKLILSSVSLYVEDFNSTSTSWTESGASPYLNDNSNNYIYHNGDNQKEGWFSFQDLYTEYSQLFASPNQAIGASVNIDFECRSDGNDYFEFRINDGTTTYGPFSIDPKDDTDWTGDDFWRSYDVSSIINTLGKLNNAKIEVTCRQSGGASNVHIRRARLSLDFWLTSVYGNSTTKADLMRINMEKSVYGAGAAYVIQNGTVRDIVQQEAEWNTDMGGGGAYNCPNVYAQIVLTLPAKATYYTYQLRLMFIDSMPSRNITDLCPIKLTTPIDQLQTENGTVNGIPIVANGTGDFSSSVWAHHWSQFISGSQGAGIMFTNASNQQLYAFDATLPGTPTGALKINNSTETIELLPVTLRPVVLPYALDVTWHGAVATFDGTTATTPIYAMQGTAPTGLWLLVEYPPKVTVFSES